MNIEIEVYAENGKKYVYLSHDGSSGCKYEFNTKEELKSFISSYVDAVDFDLELNNLDEE